jgi:hypothetical protein
MNERTAHGVAAPGEAAAAQSELRKEMKEVGR